MMKWAPVNRDTYRVKSDGRTWLLRSTPQAKYPWLLHTSPGESDYEETPVGSPEVETAQRQAELWLSLRYLDELSHKLGVRGYEESPSP
ncbi:hypothetical protein ACFWY9_15735 [Amycolatopsis sp. NPDC059027]|uniref:hypothetical protein n=1 Tax=Amycolatopsis sp. NPDC059027 TaxID=3346709 RepID=UPI00366BBEB3